MSETIYTIPVTDAFNADSECPLCEMYLKFQEDAVKYYLGPSLMQPEIRIRTNNHGFCGKHFRQLLDSSANRLGLGLIIDTYLKKQMEEMAGLASKPDKLVQYLKQHQEDCCICTGLEGTMERYVEIILQRWEQNENFRKTFSQCKGFCQPHFTMLLESSGKYISGKRRKEFVSELMALQLDNLKRIEGDVDWFTKKFDYRYRDEDWKNSKDALERSVAKITGRE